ncbi:MAG TPA: M15 family metallopeptidase [Oculatellaceae cyanobacterium]
MSTIKEDLRELPIPERSKAKTAADYHNIEIDLAGPANKEPLIDVQEYGIACKSMYSRPYAPYYRAFAEALETVYLRDTVAQKLVQANNILVRYGVEVLALDGFRPVSLQLELWEHFMEQARQQLPEASLEDMQRFAAQFCSNPTNYRADDYRTWPVHSTGGAIDLTLRSLYDKQELFMGSIFDDADSISYTTHFESFELTSQSGIEARRNRRLLYHSMIAVGFANYPYEWWHFDFGSQMWVMNGNSSQTKALYGRTEVQDS